MDNIPPTPPIPPQPPGGQQNHPPDNTNQGASQSAETERIIVEPSSTPAYIPPAGEPYTGQTQYTGQPEYVGQQPTNTPSQPTVPMGGPLPGYQPPLQQAGGTPVQGYQPPPQGYAPPPSTPQFQQQYQQQYQQPYPPQGQTVVTTQKKGGMPAWAMVLIGLFVGLLLVCGLAYWFVMRAVDETGKAISGAGDTIGAGLAVVGFDAALRSNDYAGAYSYLGGDIANRYTEADLQQRWEALSSGGTVATNTTNVKFSQTRPQIVWSLTPSGGSRKDVTLTLTKSGSDWKIVEASPDLIPSP